MTLTVIVGADVQTSSLACGNGLVNTEKGSPKGANALFQQDRARAQCRTSAGNLDAETILRDSDTLELFGIASGVLQSLLGIISVGREGLEKNPALNIVDVGFGHQDCL